jgi:DNA-binding transcriptional MerR regulator
MEKALPAIPAKRYFTIGEVSELCGVKPYVLRYWEQEFTQLRPMKRRGNRRYYQHHEVLLIRRIRELLYDQGFTISGARNRLSEAAVRAVIVRAEPVDAAGLSDAGGRMRNRRSRRSRRIRRCFQGLLSWVLRSLRTNSAPNSCRSARCSSAEGGAAASALYNPPFVGM